MIDDTYPVLSQLFGAYLNQDFPEEYGTATAAAIAFASETKQSRRDEAIAEIDALLGERRDTTSLIAAISELGCEYYLDVRKDDPIAFMGHLRETIASIR